MDAQAKQALRDEIRAKVAPAIIHGRDENAIAVALSAGRTRNALVPIADLQAYLQTAAIWWAIKAASRDPEHPAHAAAEVVMDVANARYENVDLALPVVAQQLKALEAAGLMTAAQLLELQNMSIKDDPVSAFEVLAASWSLEGEWLLNGAN